MREMKTKIWRPRFEIVFHERYSWGWQVLDRRGQAAVSNYFYLTKGAAMRGAKKAKRLMALAGEPVARS
jgi:hypothetical protein